MGQLASTLALCADTTQQRAVLSAQKGPRGAGEWMRPQMPPPRTVPSICVRKKPRNRF
jgi:hypothetical protein